MPVRILPVVSVLLVLAAGNAAASTILIVGDSLSAAYGMPVDQGWVALLRQRLERECPVCRVVNASISGDTTATARARLPQALTAHPPDILILELGGNDGLRGLSLKAMQQNLAAMIETATASGARVLLLGVRLPPNYGQLYTEKFHAVYRRLTDEYDVALVPSIVDGVGTRAELMQADGIHPNARAQPYIAEQVLTQLRPLLK